MREEFKEIISFRGKFKAPFEGKKKQTNYVCSVSAQMGIGSSNVMTSFQRAIATLANAMVQEDKGKGFPISWMMKSTQGEGLSVVEMIDEAERKAVYAYHYQAGSSEEVWISKDPGFSIPEKEDQIGVILSMLESLYRADPSMEKHFSILFSDEWEEFYRKKMNGEEDADLESLLWESIAVCSDWFYRLDTRKCFDMIKPVIMNQTEFQKRLSSVLNRNKWELESGTIYDFGILPKDAGTEIIKRDEFIGRYAIDKERKLTEEEKQLMDSMPLKDEYIIDPMDVEICEDILASMNSASPFDFFIFEGEPGSGKSSKVLAISHALNRPLVIVSCHPTMEFYDLISKVVPPKDDDLTREGKMLIEKINQLGGMNYKNIAKVLDLPDMSDVAFAPEDVYEFFGGPDLGRKPSITDALKLWNERIAEAWNDSLAKISAGAKQNSLTFAETPFLKAVRNGWIVEIQEPTLIINEGVLAGLNSLLQEKTITLETGEVVKRHKENIIFCTTNVDLEGCRNMNQALMDRAAEIYHIDSPDAEVMAQRASAMSGNEDIQMITEMAKVVTRINEKMHEIGVSDGSCGMRSLINWAIKARTKNPVSAAESTIINKVSLSDADAKDLARSIMLESRFYEKYAMK